MAYETFTQKDASAATKTFLVDTIGTDLIQTTKLDGGGDGLSAPILGDSTNGLDVDVTRLPALVTGDNVIGRAKVTDGTNVAAVKAASTPAAAADPALVTTLSPNSPTQTVNQGSGAGTSAAWPIRVTDGTTQAAVKAASVAPAATDPALVVSLSPNGPLPAQAAATSTPHAVVSLGNSQGKAIKLQTGTLASSAATADQVVLTYTVTAGKTLYVDYVLITVRLTTFAATATPFGTASIETPSGTKGNTFTFAGTGFDRLQINFAEPLPIAAGVVFRIVTTPAAATAMTWNANFGGYEK